MSKRFNRRVVLGGAGAAIVVVGAGGFAATRFAGTDALAGKSPDSEAAAYVKLLAEVRDDYINGRVQQHDGWILSQHEFDTIGSRAHRSGKDADSVG